MKISDPLLGAIAILPHKIVSGRIPDLESLAIVLDALSREARIQALKELHSDRFYSE